MDQLVHKKSLHHAHKMEFGKPPKISCGDNFHKLYYITKFLTHGWVFWVWMVGSKKDQYMRFMMFLNIIMLFLVTTF